MSGVRTASPPVEVDEAKRLLDLNLARQAKGAKIWETYVCCLFACMCFHESIPVFEWEEKWTAYDWFDLATWMGDNMWLPCAIAAFYLVSIFSIQAFLRDKKTLNLKNSMALWNLFLAVFSFCGSVRTVPVLISVLRRVGLYGLMCENTLDDWVVRHPAGTWSAIFLLSKIPELIDTYFIVLQGKRLITLHWVHHFTVMLVSWHGLATLSFNGLIFVCMNFTIHAGMYFFYFLGAMGYRPTKYAKMLTKLQISQMMTGILCTLYLLFFLFILSPLPFVNEIGVPSTIKLISRETDEWELQDHGYCKANAANVYFSMGIYICYFSLFTHFYIQAYIRKGSRKKPAKKPAKSVQSTATVKQSASQSKAVSDNAYMKIDGVVYDVQAFARRHPGGSVIKHYYGADASQVFEAFHFRSPKARKILKSLPVLKEDSPNVSIAAVTQYEGNTGGNEAMLKDFDAWRQSLVDRGFFEPSIGHAIYRNIEILALWFVSCVAFSWGQYFIGISFLGLAGGRTGWLMHEGGHGSLTGNLRVDKMIQTFWYGFMDGMSGSTWNNMHNRHHASTQKIKHDTDLDTMPLVAFHKQAIENNNNVPMLVNVTWLRFQHVFFFVFTSPLVLAFWSFVLHPMNALKKNRYDELFWMGMSHFMHTLIIQRLTGSSILAAYGVFWLARWWSAIYIFSHFSLSHTHLETLEADQHSTWVDQAMEHTVDIDTQSPVVNWIMGYLNCQVVHHLFPQMPQFRHPIVSKELEGFAKKWGRPYKHISYIEAWKRTYLNLKEVGEHYADKQKKM